jgi:hypothetical protein
VKLKLKGVNIYSLHQIFRDNVKEDYMGGACSTHGEYKNVIINLNKKSMCETGAYGSIILKWMLR